MIHSTTGLHALPDTVRWPKMLKAVEMAGREVETLEAACEAKGYLHCLYDVGVIGISQFEQMTNDLQEVCARQVAQGQRSPPHRHD